MIRRTKWADRLSWRGWLAVAIVALVVVGGYLAFREQEPVLKDVERATQAGEEAQSRSEKLESSLEDIAENLRAASGLSDKSDRIEELTTAQRRSLISLIDLLESQLETLERSSELVGETESETKSLAELSEEQTTRLGEAVEVLERLKSFARRAGAKSADLARSAAYSARLAEDSQKAFKP